MQVWTDTRRNSSYVWKMNGWLPFNYVDLSSGFVCLFPLTPSFPTVFSLKPLYFFFPHPILWEILLHLVSPLCKELVHTELHGRQTTLVQPPPQKNKNTPVLMNVLLQNIFHCVQKTSLLCRIKCIHY